MVEIKPIASGKNLGKFMEFLKKNPVLTAGGVLAVGGGAYFLLRNKPEESGVIGITGYPEAPATSGTTAGDTDAVSMLDDKMREMLENMGLLGELQLEMSMEQMRKFEEKQQGFMESIGQSIEQSMRQYVPTQEPLLDQKQYYPTQEPLLDQKQYYPVQEPAVQQQALPAALQSQIEFVSPRLKGEKVFATPVTDVVGGSGGGYFVGSSQAVQEYISTKGGGRDVGTGALSVDYRGWEPSGGSGSQARQAVTIVTGKSGTIESQLSGMTQSQKLATLKQAGLIQ